MVASSFQASLQYVLSDEGGNDDDPQDHGGRTSRGITAREYSAWLAEQGRPDADVWNAPQSDIDTIYHDKYWEPYCDLLPVGIDYMFFDMSVNAGPYRAAVLLQQALGVAADGQIGPITRQAIASADPTQLASSYAARKTAFYTSLHQPRFIRGWLNRVADVQKNALAMIDNGVSAS